MFERELWEEYRIVPEGHPWLKGVRFPHNRPDMKIVDYPFYKSESTAIHEVGVGPVHAGVIEPGHFRFLCEGEDVHHLEIQLGYQHRGIQELMKQGDLRNKITLVEAIAGDTAIGHGLAYCRLLEGLCKINLPEEVHIVRAFALEMERIALHLGDLSALAGDIAYLSGQSFFAAMRTTIINSSLLVCGSRYGKRWLKPGGINYGMSPDQIRKLKVTLKDVREMYKLASSAMFSDSGVLSRFDGTGVITKDFAESVGITGMAARSTGIKRDSRENYPIPPYHNYDTIMLPQGDVYARAYLRVLEIDRSLDLCLEWLESLSYVEAKVIPLPGIPANSIAVSITEGWRGEIVHMLRTDGEGGTAVYKVYDPSFHNWSALAMSVRNNGISDFPICNKSFNLSYCGFDL
jgi:Ni,Fe-hydrogenase III large subunit